MIQTVTRNEEDLASVAGAPLDSLFFVIAIYYADRVQSFNPCQLRGVVATPHEFSELDATPFGVSR